MKKCLASVLKLSVIIGLLCAEQAALSQSAATLPLRLGDFARTLSEKDVADIEAIAQSSGGKPWLLEGPVGQTGFSIRVYLPAETQTRELRRGPAITLVKRPGESAWTKRGTAPTEFYAQVALAGRDFNAISGGDDDLNRPFTVSGTFDDADLISLVAFIRSKPANVESSWPIEFVGRMPAPNADMVEVRLNQPSGSLLMRVRVKKQGSGWVIESAQNGRA